MLKNKFVAIGLTGVLTMSAGLVACGGSSASGSASATAASSASTETAASTAEDSKIVFWQGTTSDGQNVFYSADDAAKTATLAVVKGDASDGKGWSGKTVEEAGKITITDESTNETATLNVIELSPDYTSLKVNVDGYGEVSMKPITQGEFNKAVEGVVTAVVAEAAAQAAEELSKTTFYWEGTLSNGSSVIYNEDIENKEAMLTISNADGSDIKSWTGTMATENGKTTITDKESKQTIAITKTPTDEKATTQKINIDGYGEVELKQVTGEDLAKQAEQFLGELAKQAN